MPSIRGRYEYDDEDLKPGQGKDGGLHQNLFDEAGKLKANARFIPDDEDTPEPPPEYHFVYVSDEPARRSKEQEEWEELILQVANRLLAVAIERGTPIARRFWIGTVRPALQARVDAVREWRTQRRERHKSGVPSVVDAEVARDPRAEIVAASAEFRRNMSSTEAQARYLLALAARRFSDEQMTALASADIADHDGIRAIEETLSTRPPAEVARMLAALEADPSLLTGKAGAGLELVMGLAPIDSTYLALEAGTGT